jgi:sigma-B regulation protein RsbU (phosphoserine phosphatase)
MNANRVPVISLDGLWRFHTGDDARWADPQFDDSQWPLLRADKSWTEQGYKDYSGVAWYRFKVVVSKGSNEPLTLERANLFDSFEIFANGQRVGSCGSMPPHPALRNCPLRFYNLPANLPGGVLSIAMRVWASPVYAQRGPIGVSRIGTTAEMEVYASSRHDHLQRLTTEDEFLLLLEGLLASIALTLFLLSRANREYLYFGLLMVFDVLARGQTVDSVYYPTSRFLYKLGYNVGTVGFTLAFIAFVYVMLRGRRSIWLYLAILGPLIDLATPFSAYAPFAPFAAKHFVGINLISHLAYFPAGVWLIAFVTRRAFQGSFYARLLVVPVVVGEAIDILYGVIAICGTFGWHLRLTDPNVVVFAQPFQVHLEALADVFLIFALLIVLINRFIGTRRDHDRFTAELEAAGSVQRLLLPSAVPDTPGFVIESVYLPAQEVGGDFFHVAHGADGSVLIVVGDVSGKGLSAAMTVSAIIGALRGCTGCAPAEVLVYLNRVLHGHISGFATCCAALLDAGGGLSMANAGHLSPYRNGEELPLEGGLPLGLVEDAEYTEAHFMLADGDRLTFISDGVVEAMNPQGELFGFERTLAICQQPAQTMANTAKAFGQEDDITVLAVSYLPSGAS